jgi:hypothetical protein
MEPSNNNAPAAGGPDRFGALKCDPGADFESCVCGVSLYGLHKQPCPQEQCPRCGGRLVVCRCLEDYEANPGCRIAYGDEHTPADVLRAGRSYSRPKLRWDRDARRFDEAYADDAGYGLDELDETLSRTTISPADFAVTVLVSFPRSDVPLITEALSRARPVERWPGYGDC